MRSALNGMVMLYPPMEKTQGYGLKSTPKLISNQTIWVGKEVRAWGVARPGLATGRTPCPVWEGDS
jgi:hypothetical protein